MTLTDQVTRESLIAELRSLDLDWGDEEDLIILVDDLLKRFTPLGAWTWLAFWDEDLGGIPIVLVRDGRARDVIVRARVIRMTEQLLGR